MVTTSPQRGSNRGHSESPKTRPREVEDCKREHHSHWFKRQIRERLGYGIRRQEQKQEQGGNRHCDQEEGFAEKGRAKEGGEEGKEVEEVG